MFKCGNLELPDGTKLNMLDRMTGNWHEARIVDSMIVDRLGRAHNSFSAVARACVGASLNGWVYWLVKRPDDDVWTPASWLEAGRTAKEDLRA